MIKEKGILRIIDANYNRAKEGFRVLEDIYRFARVDDKLRKKIRKLRHDLDILAQTKAIKAAINFRDSKNDLGKKTDCLESRRKSLDDIIFSNLQRAKESTRVLEEFFKLENNFYSSQIKKIRYRLYSLEKQIKCRI